MTCDQIERDDIAERYVAGRLGDEDRARFEAHYFDCARCLERVEQLESVRDALTSGVVATTSVTRPSRRLWHVVGGLAAAAILVLAVREIQSPSPSLVEPNTTAPDIVVPQSAPTANLETLGAIAPPPFTPPILRSTSESRRVFLSAMETYSRGDYAAAIPALERAVRAEPASPAGHFFLAVCHLQLDRRPEAIEQLREVIRLGESPYLEDAHFFVAKASIRSGDIETARGELRTVMALDGDRRDEASRLLNDLP